MWFMCGTRCSRALCIRCICRHINCTLSCICRGRRMGWRSSVCLSRIGNICEQGRFGCNVSRIASGRIVGRLDLCPRKSIPCSRMMIHLGLDCGWAPGMRSILTHHQSMCRSLWSCLSRVSKLSHQASILTCRYTCLKEWVSEQNATPHYKHHTYSHFHRSYTLWSLPHKVYTPLHQESTPPHIHTSHPPDQDWNCFNSYKTSTYSHSHM